jgi:hypothetical protein
VGRLVEFEPGQRLSSTLEIQVGDVLLFRASGGKVLAGTDIVESLGAFTTSTPIEDGRVLAPMGGPDTVLFLAKRPGRCRLEIVSGDAFQGTGRSSVLDVSVRNNP